MEDAPPLTEYELLTRGKPPPNDVELVASLHENPTFLPASHVFRSLGGILLILLVLCGLSAAFLWMIRSLRLCHTPKKTSEEIAAAEWIAGYKAVSLVMNFVLGAMGTYHFFVTLPATTVVSERIEGHEEMAILANLQIAYQLWAIPMGMFFVNEPVEMLFHHVGVMVVGSLSAFFTNGFRYHDPFFFGLIETSSVPLVLMNIFKENSYLAEKHPTANILVQLSFCLTFLVTRVFMWLPQASDFIRLAALLCQTSLDFWCQVGLGSSIVTCVFLTTLQLFWAGKIVKGVVEFVVGNKV